MLYKLSQYIFIVFTFILCQNSFSQESTNSELYNWFDNLVGRENLDINNGALYLNLDKTGKSVNRFIKDEVFLLGSVFYDNHLYENCLLNYDVSLDLLVLKFKSDLNRQGLYLRKDKTFKFEINNQKFVNLSYNKSMPQGFENGFYEENFKSENFTFYIKTKKIKSKIIEDDKNLDNFIPSIEFVIYKEGSFYKINSKRNIIDLFLKEKQIIKDFYENNYKLERENKQSFYHDLFKNIAISNH